MTRIQSSVAHVRPSSRSASLCLLFAAAALAGCGSGGGNTTTTPPATLTVSGSGLSAPTVGVAYSSTVAVSGGSSPYTCAVASGSLPTGLSFGANCKIVGTPTAAGTFTAVVSATDSSSPAITGSGSITLVAAPPALVFSSTTLPSGLINTAYTDTLPIAGGTPPYTCTLSSGTLPTGLTLGANCQITGTPSVATFSSFAVKAADAGSQTVTATLSLTINSSTQLVTAAGLPVVGASVQFYAAGTTGSRSAPTALLATPLVTDATGSFHASPTQFTCPSSSAILYAVATGGAAGTNPANSGAVLMAPFGTCGSFAAGSAFVLNEATTAASAYGFAQFLGPGAALGASATNLSGITLAAGTVQNLVDITSGRIPGASFPSTGTAPAAKLNLLGTLIAACITNSGTACSTLYADATPSGGTAAANTLDAALNLVTHPSLNVSALYTLAAGEAIAADSPLPDAAPSDWVLFVPFTGGGMSNPDTVSIDSKGRIWVANYNDVASLFTNTGTPVASAGYTASGLENTFGAALDASDNIWIANEEGGTNNLGTITILNSAGQSIAGSPLTQGPFDFPTSVAIDTNGNVWVVDYGLSFVTLLSSSGQPLSGSSGFTSSQLVFPIAVAVDSQHNAWVVNQSSNTVTKIAPDGSSFTSYVVGVEGAPSGVAVDQNDFVWTANYADDAVGLVSPAGKVVSGTGITGGGLVHPESIAIDGAGSAWITNYRGPSITQLAASTAASPGAPISPTAGWAPDANVTEAYGIAIDQAGNLWVTSYYNNTLVEYIGLAVPIKTPRIGPPATP